MSGNKSQPEPSGVDHQMALVIWLTTGERVMPTRGIRLGKPEVLPRKAYPADQIHSDSTCLLNYQGAHGKSRSWFCETHHQWAYEFAVRTLYVFADGETSRGTR